MNVNLHSDGVLFKVSRKALITALVLFTCLILGQGSTAVAADCKVACLTVSETPNCFSIGVVQNSATDQGELLITRPHIPVSITFEVSVSVCTGGDVMTFQLNGVELGRTLADPARGCVCSPGVQQFAVTNTALIEAAWVLNGENVLRFTKTSSGGSYYSWVRAVLDDGQARATACINDYQGGNCDVLNQCSAGYTSAPIDVSASIDSPFETVLLRQAYSGSELPGEFDLSGLGEGLFHFSISGAAGRDRISFRKASQRQMKLNRPCNNPPTVTCPASLSSECGGLVELSFGADDPDRDNLNYVITVNGSPAQSGQVADGVVHLQRTFQPGVYTVGFAVQDAATSVECSTTLTVRDTLAPQLSVRGNNPAVVECHGTFVDAGALAVDACAGELPVVVSGNVDTATPGSYTLTYSVSDPSGNNTTDSRIVHVVDTTAPVVICQPAQASAGVNCLAAIPQVIVSASDNCAAPEQLVVLQEPPTGQLVGPGTHLVRVTVSDLAGNSAVCETTFEVVNTAPMLSSIAGPTAPVPLGTSVAISFSFMDANQGHVATIDWNDGTQSNLNPVAPGAHSVQHTYAQAGVYAVTVIVTDACGASAQAVFQYVVVFDSGGGFVTGGGWLNSPAGAYVASPSAAGRGYFGFVAKTLKDATVPMGKTRFELQAAGITFNSTSYEWLSVSGNRAQLRGAGKVNGTGDYIFLATVTDYGATDTVRLQIWNRLTGAPVYDNASATAIAGGNITVHP